MAFLTLILVSAVCYFTASQCDAVDFNLKQNKLKLVRNRRDGIDSFDAMSINGEMSNEYSALSEYPTVDKASTLSEGSASNEKNPNVGNEGSTSSSYFDGKEYNY